MSTRTRFGIALALMLLAGMLLLALQLLHRASERNARFDRTFPIMGTVAEFTFFSSPENARDAADAARAVFDGVVKLCNIYDPESELSRLNASAAEKPFRCSPELWFLLLESRKAYLFSDGAFDITAKPLMDLWGFYRKRGDSLPSEQEVAETQSKVGLDKVIFNDADRTVKFTVPGMSFDLGGIAKGYAVDRAFEAVSKFGIRRGVINLGGNLRLLPEPPPGQEAYRVGVKNPANSGELLDEVLELCSVSLSTSGDYERYVKIGGVRYGHIMNPVTGRPTQGTHSVTVIAPSAMLADWLSTAIFIQGEGLARRAESSFGGVAVIVTHPARGKR
ncbi:MAG: FAD:protein FMN transferase [Lentisphaeria bacterium]|nr:FAD:protein FMN transferase [Lentisphaeria bacterium]